MNAPTVQPLPILIVPHPALRRRAEPVTEAHAARIKGLVPRMLATMYAAPGIGLAAPQVDVSLRVVVIDVRPDDQRSPMVLLNPEIVWRSDDQAIREEGCLSLPEMFADVTRPSRVRVRYRDEAFASHELEAEGLLAVCLQHEIDHLDGVLFVDHLSSLKRGMILRKLAKARKSG